MQASPQTAGPGDSVTEAAARMADARIGCLPITSRGELVGIVTTTDILAALVHDAMEPAPVEGPVVADLMTRDPITVHRDDHLLDAAARMRNAGIRHLPVIDAELHVIGMLSDRDLRTVIGDPSRALEAGRTTRVDDLRVADAMSSPVTTTAMDARGAEVARYFIDHSISAVPVVDDDDRLVGIVSYIDILRVMA
jgi:CBS domain-containing protein